MEEAFIDKIQNIIRENLEHRSFSTQFLCDELHMSRSQLHRRIKQHTGLSTSLFIRRIRLARGKELLETSDYNVSEIAYLSGIDSPQNFSEYFAEEYGVTPSLYRKHSSQQIEKREIKATESGQPVPPINLPLPGKTGYPGKYRYYALAALSVLLMTVFLYSMTRKQGKVALNQLSNSAVGRYENSIAVLPFANFGSETKDFFTDGIVEDILTNLAYFEELKVISRTSSMTYKNTRKTIREIANELKVAYLLEGSVRQHGEEVKVTAQLIRAADDFHVWAKNYTREVEDIFQLQSEISMDIAMALNQRITVQVSERIAPPPLVDFKAYNEFLIGRNLLISRSEEGIKEGIRRFDNALAIDPDFNKVLAFKANAYHLLAGVTYKDRDKNSSIAEDLALQTIGLDPGNGLAYATLGSLYKDQNKWKQSKTSFEIALELSPNDALTNYWYSLLLRETGQVERSVLFSSKAIELDPLYPIIYAGHIVNCIYAGDHQLVGNLINDGKMLFDNSFAYHWAIAKSKEHFGDYEGALLEYDRVLGLNPGIPTVENARTYCLGRLGHHQEVRAYIDAHQDRIPEHYIARTVAYSGLNDVEASLSSLLSAADSGVIPTDIKVDPKFDLLRDHPGFKEIMQKFGLHAGAEHEDHLN